MKCLFPTYSNYHSTRKTTREDVAAVIAIAVGTRRSTAGITGSYDPGPSQAAVTEAKALLA
jgi:hypothetical protein